MKTIMTTVLLFLATVVSVAQNSISGTVVDNNNESIVGVNVIIQGTDKGVQTDMDGKFEIKNVPSGNFKLVISFIGFKTKVIDATASNNLTVTLYEGNELLQEVEVTSRNNKFSRKKTAYVSKLPLKDLENSQVYSTITSELLESQIITNVEDALVNSTGISKLWEATGRAPGEGTGYFAVRGFATQSQLVDGMPGFTLSALDPSYIERIEVVKGPSATLFGSTATSLGGLINIVTKKPYKGLGGSVSFTAGSFGLNRLSLDYNTPLSTDERTYFRLNATNLSQNSFQDAGFRDSFFVAPSITHKVNNRLNISFGFEFAKTSQTNPSMLFVNRLGQGRLTAMLAPFGITPTVPTNVAELNVNPKKSFTSNDVALNSLNFNTRTIVDYKISNEWSSQTIFASSYARTKGFYQYNIDGGAAAILQLAPLLSDPRLAPVNPIISPIITPMLIESGTLLASPSFTRIFDKRNANATNYNIQQNFIGDFKIGDLRNRFVGGLDFVSRSQHSRNQNGNPTLTSTPGFAQLLGFFNNPQAFVPFPLDPAVVGALQATGQQVGGGFNALPYFDAFLDAQGNVKTSTFTPNAVYSPTKASLENIFSNVPVNDFKTNSKTYAAYISNVLNVTPELTVNLGLRVDHFDQDGNTATTADDYTKTTFSPKAGVVYQVIPNELSIFGNYQTGFVNKDPVITQTGIQNFKPIKANQFEGGVKTNLFNNKLNLGASYYHIIANNVTTTDPTAFLTTNQIDLKEVVSKGIELEANSSPFAGLNLRASYAYNDSKVTDANSVFANRNVAELLNRRPEEAGPKTTYNFWADYRFQHGKFLKNIGLGAGFNGASEHLTINNAISGTFTLPSYTVFNAGAYYDTDKFRVALKVNNLTNETYYKGWSTVNAQAPRAFLGTVTYKF
ncbi:MULTISPECIES: TonB-dependent receptor [unclassified Tenacibaculum]|uniref:TonB-dependent receptor n=1 Tax=unclassified Tenacibaculum TaxID=2635139 RepID=UPI001F25CAF6|nr:MULTISPECIES: TonB-dependent receptor [unclassified Tenacibaculum]MCF2874644.1 TonB-dependent receptor [Tenacibaculum sp. Cn5-1]MCF2934290.1 TonB-dependent receptor [Tenacibaculum sp. Cn5-34]MCG7510500.1 TonB-dependent receptor [Tenacibaculum sp. Cn5-46]